MTKGPAASRTIGRVVSIDNCCHGLYVFSIGNQARPIREVPAMTASFRVSQDSTKEDLLTKIDGQKRQIAKQEAKIDRQRAQIAALSERATERNHTIAAQDRVIAEQGDEIEALKEQIARLQETQEGLTR